MEENLGPRPRGSQCSVSVQNPNDFFKIRIRSRNDKKNTYMNMVDREMAELLENSQLLHFTCKLWVWFQEFDSGIIDVT